MITKNHKKVCTTLNYSEHFLVVESIFTGCASISAFPSLVGIPMGIMSSVIGLKICVITAAIKNISQLLKEKKRSMTNSIVNKIKIK